MSVTIGVDVGGTKIAAGVVDESGAVLSRTRRTTPSHDEKAIIETIASAVLELSGGADVVAVGIGSAGYIDSGRSRVYFSPNLALREVEMRDLVGDAVGLPVVVENDANAAAWAEFRFGAAHDVDDMVLLTIGTGVGGGLVLGGELYRGSHGIGGELGHAVLVRDGQLCGCGLRGCVEAYASGTALVRHARSAARNRESGAERLLELAGGDVDAIGGHMVTAAAHEGDALAVGLLADLGRWLGLAMASYTMVIDPAVFVIGGGVSDAGDLLVGPAAEALHANISGSGYRPEPEVRLATLGNDAGIVGAADLARR